METAKKIAEEIGEFIGGCVRIAIQTAVATFIFINVCQIMNFYFV